MPGCALFARPVANVLRTSCHAMLHYMVRPVLRRVTIERGVVADEGVAALARSPGD